MKIEVRENSIFITGYVNAIERFSKPIRGNLRGKMQKFIEKIEAGVFKTALKRNEKVEVRLNHNPERVLANMQDGTAILEEDNIGLRAEVTITDAEVIEKAKNNKLVGWSFGFYANSDEVDESGEITTRSISDMDLIEVSILDDTKSPAYYGTSIETRSEGEKELEIRTSIEEIEAEAKAKHDAIRKIDYEALDKEHQKIENEKKDKLVEYVAELVANKIIEKLNLPVTVNVAEENRSEETKTEEKEKIDYSEYEERLKKISPNN